MKPKTAKIISKLSRPGAARLAEKLEAVLLVLHEKAKPVVKPFKMPRGKSRWKWKWNN